MQIGIDQLTYRQTNDVDTQYHMAFNIPENVFQQGKAWLVERTPLLIKDGQDEIYFVFTDSHSCYFYDPDENVLELIARHQINPTKEDQTFEVTDILGIGEMSLTVKDVLEVGEQLAEIGVLERRERPLNGASLNFLGPVADGTHILLVPHGSSHRRRRRSVRSRWNSTAVIESGLTQRAYGIKVPFLHNSLF